MNDRVPPGQHLVSGFPVLHVGPVPPFDPKTWRLRISGLVAEARRLLTDEAARRQMKTDLAEVAARLSIEDEDPIDRAVTAVRALMQRLNKEEAIHV